MRKLLCALMLLFGTAAFAQQTIFNIPSADVLDKGQGYLRLDTGYLTSSHDTTIAPNFIFGAGHNVEAGINVNAFGIPGDFANRSIVPNVKWKPYSKAARSADSRTEIYLGDQLFIPTFHRSFHIGNYFYAAGAFTMETGTRITAGAYDSQNVYAPGNKAGAILGFEQTVKYVVDGKGTPRPLITPAVDWQSGQGGNGFVTLGVMVFPTSRLMLIPAFAIPNSGDHNANTAQVFIGYLFKK